MYNQFPYTSIPRAYNTMGNIPGLVKKFNWDSFLNNTQRTLNVINQAMPIYNQVKPMFKNMSTIFKVIGELNTPNAINTIENENTPQFFA